MGDFQKLHNLTVQLHDHDLKYQKVSASLSKSFALKISSVRFPFSGVRAAHRAWARKRGAISRPSQKSITQSRIRSGRMVIPPGLAAGVIAGCRKEPSEVLTKPVRPAVG